MLAVLLPPRCPVCRQVEGRRPGPCGRCGAEVPAPPPLPSPANVDACVAVCGYDGAGVALVAALKFRGDRGVARWAAARIAALVTGPAVGAVDAITWVPTSSARRRRRGVDQAEVLARAVGRATGLPVRKMLRRLPGPAQAGRSAADRRAGPAFSSLPRIPAGQRVLLVDDVVTTGASVAAAARALRAGGATSVAVACLARTPPGRHGS